MICKPKRKLDHARKAIFQVLVKPFPGGVDIALVGSEWKLHLDSSVFRCMFACLIQECMQEASERPLLPPLLRDLHPAASDKPRAPPYNPAAASVLLCFLHRRPGDHTQIKSYSYLVNGKNSWQMHFLTVIM